ncbi:MAG: ATPase [Alphaproteobacteria bacterium]|jgi:chaperone required for assembly of F1-ATPase|nr:ATPase [Alphaproteobacteria bacterium]
MKRFYKIAEAGTAPGGYVIRLDGKPVKSVMQHSLIFTSKDLADAIAAEWQAQEKEIIPNSMPLMQLANTMTDKSSGPDRQAMNVELLKYGASDLICYFAATPADLVARQEAVWLPLLKWLADTHGIVFERVDGIRYHNQPPESLEKLNTLLTTMNAPDFTAAQAATALTGSVIIALALADGYLDAEVAHAAACVDEIYQLEKWGEDALARKRLDNIRLELHAIAKFRDLIRSSS